MKQRKDSAFGLHFDFHAKPESGEIIGATLKEEDIRKICREVKPDFIQIDCKGHPGWASYPTACGNAMPQFALDPLALWRKVTKEEGVALYMHYSGVWDSLYCSKHPEDAVINADGKPSSYVTRTFSLAYADKLLIPQMKELAGKYGVDGIWVDGECWATALDFHPDTVAAFEKETGIALQGDLPTTPEHAHYPAYREFCRACFRRYVRHYTDTMHAAYPNFEIATNWGYSDHMPEPVSANVDFLSGDLNPWNSFNTARYAGRAIAQQERTWDLMAWNFRHGGDACASGLPKHPIQVMQEAATVLAMGGGFQNYIPQKADGSPRMKQALRMKEVGAFIRQREPYAFRGKPVHQAALLLSAYDRGRESNDLYHRNGYERILGLTALLCDVGQSLEIISEHTLFAKGEQYKMIAVPETAFGLEAKTMESLLAYAKNGGSLMLVGVNTAKLFAQALSYSVNENAFTEPWCYAALSETCYGMLRTPCPVEAENAETIVRYGETEDGIDQNGAVVFPYGKGKIAVIAADIGLSYHTCRQTIHRDIAKAMACALYTPDVTFDALGSLELVYAEKEGKRFVHLINANGQHASQNSATEDFIPPVVDITISIACKQKPHALILRPQNRTLPFVYENGKATVTLDRVALYDMIEIQAE